MTEHEEKRSLNSHRKNTEKYSAKFTKDLSKQTDGLRRFKEKFGKNWKDKRKRNFKFKNANDKLTMPSSYVNPKKI